MWCDWVSGFLLYILTLATSTVDLHALIGVQCPGAKILFEVFTLVSLVDWFLYNQNLQKNFITNKEISV